MLRGCLVALFVWAALIGGYYWWFESVFKPPATYIAAGVVGFMTLCGLASLNTGRRAWRDWSLLSVARHGMPMVNGKVVAVSGTIHPVDLPLKGPFSGADCVACEYDLGSRPQGNSSSEGSAGSDYAGFLMVPCVIRTALGDVRLLGFPLMEGFHAAMCCRLRDSQNAREFLTTTQFEDRTGIKMITTLGAFGEIWTDDDGAVQKNMQLRKPSLEQMFPLCLDDEVAIEVAVEVEWEKNNPDAVDDDDEDDEDADEELEDLDDDIESEDETPISLAHKAIPYMTEKRVPVGISVCAIGIYNEMLGGLVPPRGSSPNRLLLGSAEEIGPRLKRTLLGSLIGGTVFLIVLHAALFGIIPFLPK